jgi:hypothetical protein
MSDYFPKNRERGNFILRRVVFGIGGEKREAEWRTRNGLSAGNVPEMIANK